MNKQMRVKRLAGALALVLATTTPAFAQNTSAQMTGRVTTEQGEALAGADVVIVHTPSGTTSRASTDAQGRFNARGLRVGGPYSVTVMRDGYQGETTENVFVNLGDSTPVIVDLAEAAAQLDAVEVVASGDISVFSPDKMGAGTNVSQAQIRALPSIGRNIQDYVRLDPRVSQTDKQRGEISVGGQNTRFNAIKIDGVSTNDPFGLESNNLPTLRQPVSIDAIEEVQIAIAEYDTTLTGATGGIINAVTKSGTNEFGGSVYYVYRDNDWVRDNTNGTPFAGFQDEETYGVTFGGPLIKDTLFFFANYEQFTRNAPGPAFGPTGSGASNEVAITDAQIAEVQDIASSVWGFDAGTLNIPDALKTDVEEYAIKLDWNINEDHRASYRYSKTEQTDPVLPGFGSRSLSLNSYWYNQVKTFESHVAQVYSDWSDTFSTEFKVSQRSYDSIAETFSDLPAIAVRIGSATLNLGTERFRHRNILLTDETNFFGAGTLYMGDHQFKFGVDYTSNDIYNLFGRDLNGVYTFNSIADFRAGTPSAYTSRAASNGDVNSIAADWTFENLGVFVQDSWAVSYNLNLLFGFRYDTPMVDDAPISNPLAQTLYGLDNTQTIDGNGLFQPRFGFNYTFDSERPTQLRGGIGLFQGAAANVWLSNPFSNTGLNYVVRQQTSGSQVVFSPDPNNQPVPAGTSLRQFIDIVSSDLEQPSVWKANLAFEHELPWYGVVASAEAILTQNETSLYYQRLDFGNPTASGQDGRMLYWNAAGYNPGNWSQNSSGSWVAASSVQNRANRPSSIDSVQYALPTNKGESQQLTLALSKPMTDNWGWMVAYTYTNATEVNPLTSSQASSNWNNNAIFQANEEVASQTNYTIRDRFSANLSYRHYFFENYATDFGLFYEGRSGKPYSWTFQNDMNGDGVANDLFYVPAGPGDVLFENADQEAAFFEFLAATPELSRYAGQVVGRNTEHNRWVNQFDVRISQELPGFFGDNKAEIALDILNVGNLLNKDWGRIEEIGFPSNRGVAYFGGIDPATGKYVYGFTNDVDASSLRDVTGESRWAAQLTFRYRF
ncbi:MAG: carboxypeptidase regulatory-like domain-containing protein [Lysobacteraceae bacterium]